MAPKKTMVAKVAGSPLKTTRTTRSKSKSSTKEQHLPGGALQTQFQVQMIPEPVPAVPASAGRHVTFAPDITGAGHALLDDPENPFVIATTADVPPAAPCAAPPVVPGGGFVYALPAAPARGPAQAPPAEEREEVFDIVNISDDGFEDEDEEDNLPITLTLLNMDLTQQLVQFADIFIPITWRTG
ncbi:hypothetical protein BC834DRAFT_841967 [Gloeopeniophorella convolvens]|nr:hypothetical protein BC834DRAFT_841967 [Gloeopeniophorella convolvens]